MVSLNLQPENGPFRSSCALYSILAIVVVVTHTSADAAVRVRAAAARQVREYDSYPQAREGNNTRTVCEKFLINAFQLPFIDTELNRSKRGAAGHSLNFTTPRKDKRKAVEREGLSKAKQRRLF